MDSNTITALVSAVSALAVALLGLLVSVIKNKTTDQRLSQIEKTDLAGVYVECPNCQTKIYLDKAKIFKEVSK